MRIIETSIHNFDELSQESKQVSISNVLKMLRELYVYYLIELGRAPTIIFKDGIFIKDIETAYWAFNEHINKEGSRFDSFISDKNIPIFNQYLLELAYDSIIDICKKYEYLSDGEFYFEKVKRK
jgi:hypothetical protein